MWRKHSNTHWLVFLLFAGLLAAALYDEVRVDFNVSIGQKPELDSRGGRVGEIEGRILVKFRAGAGASGRAEVLARHGLAELSEIKQIGVRIVSVPDTHTPQEVADRLLASERAYVEFAEADAIIAPSLTPNDPYYQNQWHLPKISAPQAWDVSTGSGSVVIGIADTGVDCAHSDLAANCLAGWNFYDNNSDTRDVTGHGTKVAGTAGAVGNNAAGVAGVVWPVKLMPLRIADPAGYASFSRIADALIYAADRGVRAVNLSYTVPKSFTVNAAAEYLFQRGGVLVMAAGNDGYTYTDPDEPYTLFISATDPSDQLYSWSNRGTNLDLSAPGGVYTTLRGGGYGSVGGTSYSAPQVAGVAALMRSVNSELTAQQVTDYLRESADDLGPAGFDTSYGWGRLNAAAAINRALGGGTPPPPPPPPPPPTGVIINSYQVASKTATTATIVWTTNIASTGVVKYGTSSANLNLSSIDNALATSHSATLTGLSKFTKYYYQITAQSSDGTSSATSPVSSFKTMRK